MHVLLLVRPPQTPEGNLVIVWLYIPSPCCNPTFPRPLSCYSPPPDSLRLFWSLSRSTPVCPAALQSAHSPHLSFLLTCTSFPQQPLVSCTSPDPFDSTSDCCSWPNLYLFACLSGLFPVSSLPWTKNNCCLDCLDLPPIAFELFCLPFWCTLPAFLYNLHLVPSPAASYTPPMSNVWLWLLNAPLCSPAGR